MKYRKKKKTSFYRILKKKKKKNIWGGGGGGGGGASLQSTTGSRGVRISGSNDGYTIFRGSVKGTGYTLHSPVSPSLPLSCVTLCHQVSTEPYCSQNTGWVLLRNATVRVRKTSWRMTSRYYPFWKHSQSVIAVSCVIQRDTVSRCITHTPTVRRILSTVRLTQYDTLPQHQVNIRKSISECFKKCDFSQEQCRSLKMILGSKHVGAISVVLT